MVILLLRLVSNDCGLVGPSSLALLPALTFVFVKVVDHVATRGSRRKAASFYVGHNVIPGAWGGDPSGARGKLRPQGLRMEFHLGPAAHFVGFICGALIVSWFSREKTL